MPRSLAVIPARGGSQRIPRKNIRPFYGRPILAYSIETALRSELFARVIVSTDDPEIAEVAKTAGAEVPFVRPADIANHTAPIITTVVHAIETLAERGDRFDDVCMLMATAPFVRAEDLAEGRRLLHESGVPSVLSVTDFGFPIFRALKETSAGALEMFWPEHELTRSNDLPKAFHDAGQFAWIHVETALRDRRFYLPGMRPVHLPRWRVQDIDTEEDWTRAEKLFAALGSER